MATLKSEFQALASELIGTEFADFAVSTVINQYGPFDYATQTTPIANTDTIGTIQLEFESSQYDGQLIKVGDYMLVGEWQELGFIPSPDNCNTIRGGVTAEVRRVIGDPADATIILHVRPL